MTTTARVQRHRDKLRAAGLRPIQLWVPDTKNPAFIEECRRQSRLLKNDPQEKEVTEWIESAFDDAGWEA
ncbi:MAG: antitoxin MazE family protein [Bacillota bacterium]